MDTMIRALTTPAECRAAEDVQLYVWGRDDAREIVPDHLLIAAQHHGALLLGAQTHDQRLVGITFSIVGLAANRQIEHYSHMAAVLPEYQNRGIGEQLKLAQREHVLAQSIERISWTYDPLESRNARLNIAKLGAVCQTYTRDYYGPMRDALNAGIPSDRFTVTWHLGSQRVKERIAEPRSAHSVKTLLAAGATLLNPVLPNELPRPSAQTVRPHGESLLLAFPAHYQRIKVADLALAAVWRLHTRGLFESAFAAGYTVTDVFSEESLSYYVLTRDVAIEITCTVS